MCRPGSGSEGEGEQVHGGGGGCWDGGARLQPLREHCELFFRSAGILWSFLEVLAFYGVELSDPQRWSRGRRACLHRLKSLLFCFACPPPSTCLTGILHTLTWPICGWAAWKSSLNFPKTGRLLRALDLWGLTYLTGHHPDPPALLVPVSWHPGLVSILCTPNRLRGTDFGIWTWPCDSRVTYLVAARSSVQLL